MIWRLSHWLFGTDYVAYMFGWDWHIRRVHYTPNGTGYIKCYGIRFLDDIEINAATRWLTK